MIVESARAQHHCHAIGCDRVVPPKLFMCATHWKRLPRRHQEAIWRTYRRGQEIRKDPSVAYLVAQAEAVLAMAIIDGRSADELARQRVHVNWCKKKLRP